MADHESICFKIRGREAVRIEGNFDLPGRYNSLYPTASAPTLLASGIPMHRIKQIDPHRDTRLKVRTIAPLTCGVLDTCTGLGYTAIEAARTAGRAFTVELDPAVLEIARRNPWSRRLQEAGLSRIVRRPEALGVESFMEG